MSKQLNKSTASKIRFSEFADDWEEKKLGEVGYFSGGGTPDTTQEHYRV